MKWVEETISGSLYVTFYEFELVNLKFDMYFDIYKNFFM